MLKRTAALGFVFAALSAPLFAQSSSLCQLYDAAGATPVPPPQASPAAVPQAAPCRWPTASHGYFDTALILDIREDDSKNDFYPFAGAVPVEIPGADPSANSGTETLGLKGGMASEAAHPSMFANGGDPKKYWELALKDYRALDFVRAYYDIGLVAHLTQDQAAPVHVANINHVITFGDKFEKAIKTNLGLFAKLQGKVQAGLIPDAEPYSYYQPLQDDTRAHLAGWTDPGTGLPYWPPAPDAPPAGQDATKGPWSHYQPSGDSYGLARSPQIMDRQMLQAAVYTSAVLKSAARRLPPVAGRLEALKSADEKLAPVDLSFSLYDNRRGEIEVSVSRPLYGFSGKSSLRVVSGGQTVPSAGFSLRLPPPAAWRKGEDLVVVSLKDEDGNVSEYRTKVRFEDPYPQGY